METDWFSLIWFPVKDKIFFWKKLIRIRINEFRDLILILLKYWTAAAKQMLQEGLNLDSIRESDISWRSLESKEWHATDGGLSWHSMDPWWFK